MAKIAMVRVDERLVHGQIVTKWIEKLKVDSIMIIDDESASNPVVRKLFKMTVPKNIGVSIYNLNDGIEFLLTNEQEMNVALLVKDLWIVRELYKNGVEIRDINIGRIPAGAGRKKVYDNVYLSHRDRDGIEFFREKGVPIFIQAVPDSKQVDIYGLDM